MGCIHLSARLQCSQCIFRRLTLFCGIVIASASLTGLFVVSGVLRVTSGAPTTHPTWERPTDSLIVRASAIILWAVTAICNLGLHISAFYSDDYPDSLAFCRTSETCDVHETMDNYTIQRWSKTTVCHTGATALWDPNRIQCHYYSCGNGLNINLGSRKLLHVVRSRKSSVLKIIREQEIISEEQEIISDEQEIISEEQAEGSLSHWEHCRSAGRLSRWSLRCYSASNLESFWTESELYTCIHVGSKFWFWIIKKWMPLVYMI